MKARTLDHIPDIVIGRLPFYLRALQHLAQEGHEVTSSHELGRRLGISSAQIRKDLSHFGGFGKQGTGYHIEFLITKLEEVLQVDTEWQVVVVGAGNLGSAIANYKGFTDRGFQIAHVFDSNPNTIGSQIGDFVIRPQTEMLEVIKNENIRVVMLAIPAEYAQEVADELIKAGVRAILNYAPINLDVPEGIQVQYIDPVVHMQHMTYYLRDEE